MGIGSIVAYWNSSHSMGNYVDCWKHVISDLNETNIMDLDDMGYKTIVFMKNATFRWDEEQTSSESEQNGFHEIGVSVSTEFKLDGISLSLEKGKLYGLVGLVGSGKS